MDRYVSDTRPTVGVGGIYPLLAGVLILGGFLRFWRIDGMFHFMGDEGTQTSVEWKLVHGHLPLLGPSLSIGGGSMHLGPLFYYLMALPLALTGGSPAGPTIAVGVFGLASIALLFLYLRGPLGDYPALAASAVMATSFLMVEYSRRPWNPTLTPFFTLLFLWALVLWKRRSASWLVLAAGSLAALLQLQPVNVFLVALLAVFILLARPQRPSRLVLATAVALFVLISSPLIIFDLSHNLANSRAWFDALLGGKSHAAARTASSPQLLFNLFNRAFEPRVIALSVVLALATVLAGVYIALVNPDGGDTNWEVLLALLLLVIAAVGFEVYRKEVFEQYMVCLFVIPFILLGALIRLLWNNARARIIAAAVVIGLVAIGVRDTWTYSFVTPQITVPDAGVTTHDLRLDDTYAHVREVDRTIQRWAQGRRFAMRMYSPFNVDTGYTYVLARNGIIVLPRASLTYVLVEPSNWPRRLWPNGAFGSGEPPNRAQTVGIVRLYELLHRGG